MAYSCKILKDSISPAGKRLTTFEITFPRFILAEFNTVRVFSRNSASSRAIPVWKQLLKVIEDPVIPEMGTNNKGMQSEALLDSENQETAQEEWLIARDNAVASVYNMSDRTGTSKTEIQAWKDIKDFLYKRGLEVEDAPGLNVHKQWVNRLLEPFMWQTVIVSSTEWTNFFALRTHTDSQPEFREIALLMYKHYMSNKPELLQIGEWHLPLILPDERHLDVETLKKVSVARCARVSYLTHDGKRDIQEDLNLYQRLVESEPKHMCFDSETEVLTDRGWKYWPEVTDEKLLSVNINTGESAFKKATLHSFDYTGKLYYLESSKISMKVTPNHRVVVKSRINNGWSDYRFQTAENTFGKAVAYKRTTALTERTSFENPFNINPVVFAKLVGFFIGDGHAALDSPNQVNFHIRKERKIKYLKNLGLEVVDLKDSFNVKAPGIGKWFRENCYFNKEKQLPASYLSATEEEVSGLLEGLRNSDGSSKRKTWRYDTTSEILKEAIQTLAHLNNRVVTVSKKSSEIKAHKDCYMLNFSDCRDARVENNQKGRPDAVEVWEDYTGKVYCATVPDGALLIRRNGKVHVSGNSPTEHTAMCNNSTEFFSNFSGWLQYRKTLPNENIKEFTLSEE